MMIEREVRWKVRKGASNPALVGKFQGVESLESLKETFDNTAKPIQMWSAAEEIKEFDDEDEAGNNSEEVNYKKKKKKQRWRRKPEEKIYLQDAATSNNMSLSSSNIPSLNFSGTSENVQLSTSGGKSRYVLLQIQKRPIALGSDELQTEVDIIPVDDWITFKKQSKGREVSLNSIDDDYDRMDANRKAANKKYRAISTAMNKHVNDDDNDGIGAFGEGNAKAHKKMSEGKKGRIQIYMDPIRDDIQMTTAMEDWEQSHNNIGEMEQVSDDDAEAADEEQANILANDVLVGGKLEEESLFGSSEDDSSDDDDENDGTFVGSGTEMKDMLRASKEQQEKLERDLVKQSSQMSQSQSSTSLSQRGSKGKRSRDGDDDSAGGSGKRIRSSSPTSDSGSEIDSNTKKVRTTVPLTEAGLRAYMATVPGGKIAFSKIFKKFTKSIKALEKQKKGSGKAALTDLMKKYMRKVEDPTMGTVYELSYKV